MLTSNRYLKPFYRAYIWIHIVSGFLILLGTMVLGGIALEEIGKVDPTYVHTVMGFITFLITILIVIGGLVAKFTMVTFKWKTKMLLMYKYGHKLFAYFTLLVAQFTIMFGILKFTSFYGLDYSLAIVHMLWFFLACIICEGIYQYVIRK